MTERRERKPITRVKDLVAQMPEQEHLDLGNAVGAGLFNARMAAKCLTDPDPQHENILQMMAYLTTAIRELSKARELIQRHS
jgi:hypothetical protein